GMPITPDEIEICHGGFVAIGNFDGVHRGHQRMVEVLTERAKVAGSPSIVMTFDPPPVALLRPDRVPPSLTTIPRRTELLKRYGVDHVVVWPTTPDLLNLTPREFFDEIILSRIRAKGMVEGPNFFFGKNRSGNVDTLAEFCSAAGLVFEVVQPVRDGEAMVSSSRIRELVAAGQLDEAIEMLGHAYRIGGKVVHGAQRGRTIGFPTANLDAIETLCPGAGVYAGFCEVEGRQYAAAINIGKNPTFEDRTVKVEVHLIDFAGDLYDQSLNVDLLSRVRSVETFDSAEALQVQIRKDVESVREICAVKASQST
ncbi:MAG: bifunctional riboflavin kinase/FAD synthetase, partial [Planctomycetaceae bacterium]